MGAEPIKPPFLGWLRRRRKPEPQTGLRDTSGDAGSDSMADALNPLNPLSPISPLNPMNWDHGDSGGGLESGSGDFSGSFDSGSSFGSDSGSFGGME